MIVRPGPVYLKFSSNIGLCLVSEGAPNFKNGTQNKPGQTWPSLAWYRVHTALQLWSFLPFKYYESGIVSSNLCYNFFENDLHWKNNQKNLNNLSYLYFN